MTQIENGNVERATSYLNLAHDYFDAARAVNSARIWNRAYWMMVSHALELSLKADLLRVRYQEEWDMMRIGHNLWSAFNRVCRERAGIALLKPLSDLVEALDAGHTMQSFRYPSLLEHPVAIDPADAEAILKGYLLDIASHLAGFSRNDRPGF